MRTIKKFDVLSVMRISGILYGIMGLFEGALVSVIFSSMPFGNPDGPHFNRFFGLIFGSLAIVFFPVLFGVMGAVFGGLGAAIYNVSARYFGGIQVQVE